MDVIRLKRGERIQAFDGSGRLYQGKILDTAHRKVKLRIEHARKDTQRSDLKITLVQALPKKNKMDYIVEKCTELGVKAIIPTQTARTIVRIDKDKMSLRRLRWQRIAREAAKQCGRTTIPEVKDLTSWPDVLSCLDNFDLKLLPCLSAKTRKLKDVLRTKNRFRNIILFVGPEGDFTPEEIRQVCNSGCHPVSLGANVLKTDTAAVSVLAMVNYEFF